MPALKLHALKQKLPHRSSKDAQDVEILVRRNGLNISQRHYEELFSKYGSRGIYEHSCESSAINPAGDLDLPIDPDFHPLPPPVSMDVLIERIAQFRKWFPDGIPTEKERLQTKVSAEFVL